MIYILAFFILTIVFSILILLYWFYHQRSEIGILRNAWIYADNDLKPGPTLVAKSIPLAGRPDYLIEKDGNIIPVEVKTGATPTEPYLNHTSQLMAYCYLVEEHFRSRPIGGFIKYPHTEFKVLYTDEARQSVIELTREILEAKRSNIEFTCNHPEHN